ncbi:hypothetical protein CEXT_312761 [Caerostris extrusa]|uniref:Uncharacterized protein n=1 Tax=Caerostris extrusa TaxID=172846 RepID=A0AAV4RCV9_CAEEX|nr:hypothetical protein CEXT_312761 [Caerostris extrusa]
MKPTADILMVWDGSIKNKTTTKKRNTVHCEAELHVAFQLPPDARMQIFSFFLLPLVRDLLPIVQLIRWLAFACHGQAMQMIVMLSGYVWNELFGLCFVESK